MNEPYQPPHSSITQGVDDAQVRRRRTFWLRAIWISIGGVIIPPMFGLIGTVVGMVGAFGALSKSGEADPEALAGNISISLLTTMWGLVFSTIALLVLIVVLFRFFTLPRVTGAAPQNLQAQQAGSSNGG